MEELNQNQPTVPSREIFDHPFSMQDLMHPIGMILIYLAFRASRDDDATAKEILNALQVKLTDTNDEIIYDYTAFGEGVREDSSDEIG